MQTSCSNKQTLSNTLWSWSGPVVSFSPGGVRVIEGRPAGKPVGQTKDIRIALGTFGVLLPHKSGCTGVVVMTGLGEATRFVPTLKNSSKRSLHFNFSLSCRPGS